MIKASHTIQKNLRSSLQIFTNLSALPNHPLFSLRSSSGAGNLLQPISCPPCLHLSGSHKPSTNILYPTYRCKQAPNSNRHFWATYNSIAKEVLRVIANLHLSRLSKFSLLGSFQLCIRPSAVASLLLCPAPISS